MSTIIGKTAEYSRKLSCAHGLHILILLSLNTTYCMTSTSGCTLYGLLVGFCAAHSALPSLTHPPHDGRPADAIQLRYVCQAHPAKPVAHDSLPVNVSARLSPHREPIQLRLLIPARTRSLMRSDSSSAIAEIKVINSRPIAPSVAMFSRLEMNSMPRLSNSSTTPRKCFVLRATRSNELTKSLLNFDFRPSRSIASSPGRRLLLPEIPTSVNSATTS